MARFLPIWLPLPSQNLEWLLQKSSQTPSQAILACEYSKALINLTLNDLYYQNCGSLLRSRGLGQVVDISSLARTLTIWSLQFWYSSNTFSQSIKKWDRSGGRSSQALSPSSLPTDTRPSSTRYISCWYIWYLWHSIPYRWVYGPSLWVFRMFAYCAQPSRGEWHTHRHCTTSA